jgi:hypothetical protein
MNRIESADLKTYFNFVPPRREPIDRLLSIQSLVFFALNLLTLGIYGAHQLLLRQKSIHVLEHKRANLFTVTKNIDKFWSNLEKDLHRIITLNESYTAEQLEALKNRVCPIHVTRIKNKEDLLPHFTIQLILNCLTMGIFSFYKNQQLDREIEVLAVENANEIQNIQLDCMIRYSLLEKKITFLNQTLLTENEHHRLLGTDKGKLFLMMRELVRHTTEINQINHSISGMMEENNKTAALNDLQSLVFVKSEELKLRLNDNLQKMVQEVKKLKRTHYQSQKDVESGDAAGKKVNQLERDIEVLTREISKYDQLMNQQKKLGEIKRPFQIRVPDDYKNPEADNYAFRDFNNVEVILEELFINSFDELSHREERGVIFNRSSNISQTCFEDNRKAFYLFLAYRLIQYSEYFRDDSGELYLKLNDRIDLKYSKPTHFLRNKTEFGQNHSANVAEIFFQNYTDDFCPKTLPFASKDLPLGIDPVAIKAIIGSFSKEQLSFFELLMLENLIPDDDAELINAKNEQLGNPKFAESSQWALNLLCDFAFLIEKKYAPLFAPLWIKEANDDSVNPYQKKSVQQIKNEKINVVPWKPKFVYFDPSLAEKIFQTHKNQSLIFQQLTKQAVEFPLKASQGALLKSQYGIPGLSQQYYNSHIGLNHPSHPLLVKHGCLFISLLSLMITDRHDLNDVNVQNLKYALVNYLNDPEIRNRYRSQIQATHKVSVNQYQRWLLKGSLEQQFNSIHNLEMGDLEIQLVAELLGIRIGVIRKGTPTRLNEWGLMVPGDETHFVSDDTSYYGPMTKEALYLYHDTEPMTYCALWPKLKDGVMSVEANQAHLLLKQLWGSFS